jgi:hypothetical protein
VLTRAMTTRRENGNALFLILIAVALFAALSYAITQSGRSGASSISSDKARLMAAQLAQFAGEVQAAVQRLQVINNCGEGELDFSGYSAGYSGYWGGSPPANPARRADGSCDVFSPAGGNVPPIRPVEDAAFRGTSGAPNNYGVTIARAWITGVGTDTGSSSSQETLILAWYLAPEVCQALDTANKIATWPLPESGYTLMSDSTLYAGTGYTEHIGDAQSPALAGHADGCYYRDATLGEYDGYFTIITR